METQLVALRRPRHVLIRFLVGLLFVAGLTKEPTKCPRWSSEPDVSSVVVTADMGNLTVPAEGPMSEREAAGQRSQACTLVTGRLWRG